MIAILGISAYYHDSAAALVIDGKLVAAAQEERFSRKKNDSSFPSKSVAFLLQHAHLTGKDIAYVAFYEKPFLKFERLLETYHAFAPKGLSSFLKAMPEWLKNKIFMKHYLAKELRIFEIKAPIFFSDHHLSHAASAFFLSPFAKAAIITVDGVGESTTTAIGIGDGAGIQFLRALNFPHSVGLLYSAFTAYAGFKVNSGEYKLMGLAPYGYFSVRVIKYATLIRDTIVDIRDDGSILLNMNYFEFATGSRMFRRKAWEELFGIPPRQPESEIRQEYIDLAQAIQMVTEEILLKLCNTARNVTGCEHLVMAGGVALNCVANGKIQQSGIFKDIFIQPAAGDSGGALGAALIIWHGYLGNARLVNEKDGMNGCFLGPRFTNEAIEHIVRNTGASAVFFNEDDLFFKVADLLKKGLIVGWFRGRMEFGPRALGNRSILADPAAPDMQKRLNLSIKFREGFRPFAPCVLEEDSSQYFECDTPSPYMLFVVKTKPAMRYSLPEEYPSLGYKEKLNIPRSLFQAVTHVDFSARIQTVSNQSNPDLHRLLNSFKQVSGYGMLVNTSLNVRGEPIVCKPEEAVNCFIRTGMDALVIENWLFFKTDHDFSLFP